MRVLIAGAAGYIGGSLIERFRDDGHEVVGLVRAEKQAVFIRSQGATAVVGGLADSDIVASAVRDVDVVINAAEADDANLVRNLVAPLEGTGKTLVHTSGSSIVVDDARGAFASDITFADDAPFEAMPHRLPRIETDRMVRTAGIVGGIRTAVICPSTIYGEGRGWKRDSHQIPLLTAQSRKLGAGAHVGAGRPIWSNVHIGDVVDLYARVMEKAPSASFFFAENGEASWLQVAEAISHSLGFEGRTASWPLDDAVAEFGGVAQVALATNCRVRATNARALLGWAPTGPSLADALTSGT